MQFTSPIGPTFLKGIMQIKDEFFHGAILNSKMVQRFAFRKTLDWALRL
jgi:hypothetical protein